MKLVASLGAAFAVHGVVLVALGQLPVRPVPRPESSELVVVHVTLAHPDPVRDSAPVPVPVAEPTPTAPPPKPVPRPAGRPKRVVAAAAAARADDVVVPAEPMPSPAEATPPPVDPLPSSPGPSPAPPPAPSHGPSIAAKPRYRSNPRPDYPIESLRHREEGTVLLLVDVTADGRASAVALKQTSGSPALDRAALETVKGWTFEPARLDGAPIASQAVVPVRFSVDER